jgi:hypothetical protein
MAEGALGGREGRKEGRKASESNRTEPNRRGNARTAKLARRRKRRHLLLVVGEGAFPGQFQLVGAGSVLRRCLLAAEAADQDEGRGGLERGERQGPEEET